MSARAVVGVFLVKLGESKADGPKPADTHPRTKETKRNPASVGT